MAFEFSTIPYTVASLWMRSKPIWQLVSTATQRTLQRTLQVVAGCNYCYPGRTRKSQGEESYSVVVADLSKIDGDYHQMLLVGTPDSKESKVGEDKIVPVIAYAPRVCSGS